MTRSSLDWRRPGEGGIATVWGIAWLFVCLTIGWAALVVASVVADQHRLDAAADLSALSAAARLERGDNACKAAADTAHDNRAMLSHCLVDGADVVLTVDRVVTLPFGVHGRLTSTARAGP